MKLITTLLASLLIATMAYAEITIDLPEPKAAIAVSGLLTTCVTVSQERNYLKIDYRKFGFDADGNRVFIGEPLYIMYEGWQAAYLIELFTQLPLVQVLQANTVFDGEAVSFNEEGLYTALAELAPTLQPEITEPEEEFQEA